MFLFKSYGGGTFHHKVKTADTHINHRKMQDLSMFLLQDQRHKSGFVSFISGHKQHPSQKKLLWLNSQQLKLTVIAYLSFWMTDGPMN